jgi:sigma-E factor negative regulatory protein RseA
MQEQTNEKISLLVDDELDSQNALLLLKKIKEDEALQSVLRRYQLMSLVLKNEESFLQVDSRFAEKIQQQISREPSYLLPRKKPEINWQKTGFAIAASIVLAVVWLVNKIDTRSSSAYPQPEIAFIAPQPMQAGVVNARFNDYLQAHENEVYFNNVERGPAVNARLVGYQQE